MGDLRKSGDPVRDLVDAGAVVFRGFVLQHPTLFRIAFQRVVPGMLAGPELTAARTRALSRLEHRVRRLDEDGLLNPTSVPSAVLQFDAMCEGLGNAELRGTVLPILPEGDTEHAWREALHTLIAGFAKVPRTNRRRSSATVAR